MSSNQELRPEQIKALFTRAASVEAAPEVHRMLRAAQRPAKPSRLWLVPVLVGVVAAVAMAILFSPWRPGTRVETALQPVAYPTPKEGNPQPAAGLTPAPLSEREALLRQAAEAAQKKDWATAELLAKKAGDDEQERLYFMEGNAQEFMALCEDAINAKRSDEIFRYCYEALLDSRGTSTYKEATALLDKGRALFQKLNLAEAKAILDKTGGLSSSPSAKEISAAKVQLRLAKDKLGSVRKLSGGSLELSALEGKANTLAKALDGAKELCEKKSCEKSGGTCNAATGACDLFKSKEDAIAKIRSELASPIGCVTTTPLIESYKKTFGIDSDYYFYKAYCVRDTNPDKACAYYANVLKLSKTSNGKTSQAKAYIQSQDPSIYMTCILPE